MILKIFLTECVFTLLHAANSSTGIMKQEPHTHYNINGECYSITLLIWYIFNYHVIITDSMNIFKLDLPQISKDVA